MNSIIIIISSLVILMSLGLGLMAAKRGTPSSRATVIAAMSLIAIGLALLSGELVGYDGFGLIVQVLFWGTAMLGIVIEARLLRHVQHDSVKQD